MKVRKIKKLVAGVGINDADYQLSTRDENGKVVQCLYYRAWLGLLSRCYRYNDKQNSMYKDCVVCEDWLYFSKFRQWMISQDWKGKHLDKDLLVGGNKTYSPETCLFINPSINSSLLLSDKTRADHPIGIIKSGRRYEARCRQGGDPVNLGSFKDPMDAHREWQAAKIKRFEFLKDNDDDWFVKIGLQRIIDKIQYDIDNGRETKDFT